MKILFYEEQHFSPNFHEFTGSKEYLPFSPFLAQKLERKKIAKIRFRLFQTKKNKKKKNTKPLL